MGRLDDLYQELQGNKAKSSSSGAGTAGAFGVQAVVTAPRSKPSSAEVPPAFEPQDFGTKKDPAKLRKQVLASREEEDIIGRLLEDPV